MKFKTLTLLALIGLVTVLVGCCNDDSGDDTPTTTPIAQQNELLERLTENTFSLKHVCKNDCELIDKGVDFIVTESEPKHQLKMTLPMGPQVTQVAHCENCDWSVEVHKNKCMLTVENVEVSSSESNKHDDSHLHVIEFVFKGKRTTSSCESVKTFMFDIDGMDTRHDFGPESHDFTHGGGIGNLY